MLSRRSQKKFSDYFSPVEQTFTDFMSRNARSLLASANGSASGHENAAAQQTPFAAGPREDRREPPREVHPPLRPDPREARCKQLRTLISSLRISRGTYITERRQVIGELSSVRRAWSKNVSALKRLEDRLAAYEYQLRLVDQPYPPSLPKPPIKPLTPGPVPDIITQGWINEMKRQIDDLRKRIAVARDVVRQQEGRLRELEGRIAHIEAKLREADALLLEPEREYNATCGELEPPLTEWR